MPFFAFAVLQSNRIIPRRAKVDACVAPNERTEQEPDRSMFFGRTLSPRSEDLHYFLSRSRVFAYKNKDMFVIPPSKKGYAFGSAAGLVVVLVGMGLLTRLLATPFPFPPPSSRVRGFSRQWGEGSSAGQSTNRLAVAGRRLKGQRRFWCWLTNHPSSCTPSPPRPSRSLSLCTIRFINTARSLHNTTT